MELFLSPLLPWAVILSLPALFGLGFLAPLRFERWLTYCIAACQVVFGGGGLVILFAAWMMFILGAEFNNTELDHLLVTALLVITVLPLGTSFLLGRILRRLASTVYPFFRQ